MRLFFYLPISILLLVITSCSLNSEQETSLNQHLTKFLRAKNECMLVGVVGFTYPEYIKELKEQGDSTFLSKIDCTNSQLENSFFYSDPTLRKIEKQKDEIHVFYELKVDDKMGEKVGLKKGLYAISKDNGQKWYFLMEEVYKDSKSCPKLKRLIN